MDEKYRIIGLLGKGGMGNVYLAENINVGNRWAVKEMDTGNKRRIDLLAEADILKKLNHRSLPRIVDVIQQGSFIYLIEDYFAGTNLKDLINSREICTEDTIVKWAVHLCEILLYLHSMEPNPVIYRDMKPGNIIIDAENNVKLIDLGIAREYKDSQDGDTVYIGTRGYAAPEQYSGLYQSDERTDIYGLGATIYHVLTGHNPNAPPYRMLPVRQVNGSLSEGIETILRKCTQNDPGLRYQNAGELMDDLLKLIKAREAGDGTSQRQKTGTTAKLMVLGSLSTRAGSSFIAANLAAAVAAKGIPAAVVELPVNMPYYHDALFFRQEVGDQYTSWPHEIQKGNRLDKKQLFSRYGVTWIAVNPALPAITEWTCDQMMQLIYSLKQFPVVILDVSTNWTHPSIRNLLPQADRLYLVADPDPVLLDRIAGSDRSDTGGSGSGSGSGNGNGREKLSQESRIVKLLAELQETEGCCIDIIVNKFTKFVDTRQMKLPFPNKLFFPFIEPAEVYRALWEGKLLYHSAGFQPLLDKELQPLTADLVIHGDASIEREADQSLVGRVKAAYKNLVRI